MRVLIGVASALVCLVATPAAQAAFPGANGRIAYTKVTGGGATDVWSAAPDGQAEVRLTEDGISDNAAFSPDGLELAFSSGGDIYVADQYANDPVLVLDTNGGVGELDWSPDGTQLVASITDCVQFDCAYDLYVVEVDGSGATPLTQTIFDETDPAWSPDGSKIAFGSVVAGDHDVYSMNSDGTGIDNLTDDTADLAREPDWSPDGSTIAFSTQLFQTDTLRTMEPDGANKTGVTTGNQPAWSPDGERIAFTTGFGTVRQIELAGGEITTVSSGSGNRDPDWQVEPAGGIPPPGGGYPRPKGATPLHVPLVIAYRECSGAPDRPGPRIHGPPLEYPSCAPPRRASISLTVGTPDANALPVVNSGYVEVHAVVGDPTTPADEADALIHVEQSDVRYNNLDDYPGELIAHLGIRLTDGWNSGGPEGSGTVADFVLTVTVPCAATAGEPGGTCAVDTTADALAPGLVRERRRAMWQLDQVQVFWEGADGAPQTPDDLLFATQGVFVP